MGLLAVHVLSMYGAAKLTISEPIEDRRILAKELGAEYTIDPVQEDLIKRAEEITEGHGYDIVLDCSGFAPSCPALPEVAALGGTLIYGAQYPNEYEMPFNISKYCYFKELTISGVYVAPYAYPRAVNLLPKLNLRCLTEKVFEFEDAVKAFEEQLTGKYPKILIRCNPDLE